MLNAAKKCAEVCVAERSPAAHFRLRRACPSAAENPLVVCILIKQLRVMSVKYFTWNFRLTPATSISKP